MKTPQPAQKILQLAIISFLCVFCLFGQPALASGDESSTDLRHTYDAVMMCINFAILVFILFKLLKNPLKNFFNNQRQTITDEISQLEQQKEQTETELSEIEKLVSAADTRIQSIRQRMIADGESIKEKIIITARQQSEYMLDAAKKNVNHQFLEARKVFQAELIDMAMSSASEKLTKEIGSNDQEKLVNQFLYDLTETGH